MVKVEIIGETALDVRKQMLELLNLEANQTIAIHIDSEASLTEVKNKVKLAEIDAKSARAKGPIITAAPAQPIKPKNDGTPPIAAVEYDPSLSNTLPDAPPWIDATLQPPEAHVTPEPLPLEQAVPVTASALREALGAISEAKGRDALTKLLATFGVKQFSKLMPNDYPAAWQAAQELLK